MKSDGRMGDGAGAELLTAAQMRAVERAAIDSGAVTGLELMERAGRGVVEAVFAEWPELAQAPHRAVVLCGPGNNGGDGFVVARLLKDWGWEVEVFLYGDPEKLPPDARVNYERWAAMGGVAPCEPEVVYSTRPWDLRVDAVFGTGLRRPVKQGLLEAFHATWSRKKDDPSFVPPRRVAVDCPSGLDMDSGSVLFPPGMFEGDVHADLFADVTVSFHRLKLGHVLGSGPKYCRKVVLADIGLEDRAEVPEAEAATLIERPEDWLSKDASDHKYDHGHVLILSGGPGKGGAARLAARGALRIGAGLVTLGCPQEALAENAAQLNAVMLKAIGDADALGRVLEDQRINTLCLGPGLGVGAETRTLVSAALAANRAVVLDADALTSFAGDPGALFEATANHPVVLTPHGGEFARLFPDIAEKLAATATEGPAYSKVDATCEAAARAGCVILFKGPDTVIAAPNGRCSINAAVYDRAAPWLATAGAGDVLAGFIAGLLARGFDPMHAAETAAWLHVECARSFGPGLIAEDLPEELPKVFRTLGL